MSASENPPAAGASQAVPAKECVTLAACCALCPVLWLVNTHNPRPLIGLDWRYACGWREKSILGFPNMGVFGVCQCFQIMHPSIALHCNLMLCMICVLAALCALCKFYDVALPSPMLQLSLSVDFQIPGQPPPSSRFGLRLTHHKYSRLVTFGRSL